MKGENLWYECRYSVFACNNNKQTYFTVFKSEVKTDSKS